jgi:xanthine dehydrogenase accessory factor
VAIATDLDLLRLGQSWLRTGVGVALGTVVRTWGSAPRPVGSHILIRADGVFEGSVSGGCVEGAVIAEALASLADRQSRLLDFGISNETAWEAGLACGGQIQILVQPLADTALVDQILDAVDRGESIGIRTRLSDGHWTVADTATDDSLLRRYAPPARLVIVGAVHITQAMVPMAQALGYHVQVVDPRTAFADAARFPGLDIATTWPDEALSAWGLDASTAVVTLTHDPKLDDPALIAALRSPAFYIAALGSRKTHASRIERLAPLGLDTNRIHGPAGLDIGALSPAEIALSVLAQMTAVARGRT